MLCLLVLDAAVRHNKPYMITMITVLVEPKSDSDNLLGRCWRKHLQVCRAASQSICQPELRIDTCKAIKTKHTVLLIASIVYMTAICELDSSSTNDQVNQLQV